jgi:hypothetical protein
MKIYNLLLAAALFFGNIQSSNIIQANQHYPCKQHFVCGTYQNKNFINCVWDVEIRKLESKYSNVTGAQIAQEFKKSALAYANLCRPDLQQKTIELINTL